jgi:hypothetical protein
MSRAPGSVASRSLLKCVVTAVAARSMAVDEPLTVTVEATAPGFNSALTVAVAPSPTRTPLRTTVSNPESSKVSAWSPGGTAENR